MGSRAIAAVAVGLLVLVPSLQAIYMRIETQLVPVARLIANLERELKSKPKDVQTLVNLARLQTMAYALKIDEFPATTLKEAQKGTTKEEVVEIPAYPPESGFLPTVVKPAPSPEQTTRAAAHLKSAIQNFREAVVLAPDNLTARLGLGWTLQQSGDTTGAIGEYRRIVAAAWPTEQKTKALMVGATLFADEAAGYLLKLLNSKENAAEIDELNAIRRQVQSLPRAITPIAIPLHDDLPESALLDRGARVRFDADGFGPRDWSWITADAGWLVYDAEGKGQIRSALQLFGNVTFWLFWSNGYEPLRALDDDGTGELSGNELKHLAIWHDRDRDGVSDPGEVRSLAAHGILSLSCRYVSLDDPDVAAMSPGGVRLTNGRTRSSYDVILHHAREESPR